jgi:hypothetical protein
MLSNAGDVVQVDDIAEVERCSHASALASGCFAADGAFQVGPLQVVAFKWL